MIIKPFGNGADLLARLEAEPIRATAGTFGFGSYRLPEPRGYFGRRSFRKELLEDAATHLTDDKVDYLLLAFDITGYKRISAFERSVNEVLKETAVLSAMLLGQDVTPMAVLLNGEQETQLFISQLRRGCFDFQPMMGPMAIFAKELRNATPRQLELNDLL